MCLQKEKESHLIDLGSIWIELSELRDKIRDRPLKDTSYFLDLALLSIISELRAEYEKSSKCEDSSMDGLDTAANF